MQRIVIDSNKDIKKRYVAEINKIKKRKITGLRRFAEQIEKNNIPASQKHIDYLNEIADYFDDIMDVLPEEIDVFLNKHQKLHMNEDELNEQFIIKKESKENETDDDSENENDEEDLNDNKGEKESTVVFWEKIVGIMGYPHVRDSIIIPYMKEQNIRACVYCNAEYLAYVDGEKKVLKRNKKGTSVTTKMIKLGRFQIDHFMPQSLFPFLCISFYNLQPSCSYCNLWKSDEPKIEFNLYTKNKSKIDPFLINLDPESINRYVLSHNINDLKIIIDTPNEKKLIKNHKDVFAIDKLYESYLDEAEEIVWKALIYNETNVEQLKENYKDIFDKLKIDVGRFLYGYYDNEPNIHIRPLTKMKQDIFKQVKELAPGIYEIMNESQ